MFNGDTNKLFNTVARLMSFKREGNYWDFKREWHSGNEELLHDIICLANNLERDESYLIIGVDEEHDYQVVDVSGDAHRRNTQQITDWLTHVKWFGSRWPVVEVVPLRFCDAVIDVVVIESVRDAMPYCLEKPNGKLGAFKVYLRRSDTNTPINENATIYEFEALWRHRLGMDMAPLDRVPGLLEDRNDWERQSRITSSNNVYYSFDPRYVIGHESDDSLHGFEYYVFEQHDPRPYWHTITITYLGQQIYDCQGVSLDGGCYFTTVPERSFFRWDASSAHEPDIFYGYFVKGSLDWSLHKFFYKDRYGDEEVAHNRFLRCVLVFDSEIQREDFEDFLRSVKTEFERRVAETADPFINMYGRETPQAEENYKKLLKQVFVLKELFSEYLAGRKGETRTKTACS